MVGAGLAGLRAAGLLCARGLDVALLDAADRPGGRVATDEIDGFRCDRGFQVLNTSYPALRAAADLDALALRAFEPGAAVRGADGRLHVFAHPVRSPGLLWRTAADELLPPLGKAKLAAWTAPGAGHSPARTARRIDRSAAQDFAAAGLAGPVVDRFLRPFLSGVLGEAELSTSAAFVRLVWRSFALGTIAVPAAGMGALPAQLAARLPAGVLRLGRRVTGLRGRTVLTEDGALEARAVLVATDPATAGALLPGLEVPDDARADHLLPRAAATRRPRCRCCTWTGPAARWPTRSCSPAPRPSYAPDGRALVASTVLGRADQLPEAVVRARAGPDLRRADRPLGAPAHRRDPRTRCRRSAPGRPVRSPVELGDGIFVAGDHRDTPSTQGALVSGRRAAHARSLAALGVA